MFERVEENLERMHETFDKAILKYPESHSFKDWKLKISISEPFEFQVQYKDLPICTPVLGQGGHENDDDNNEV